MSLPNESTALMEKLKAQWTNLGSSSLPAKSSSNLSSNESTTSLEKLEEKLERLNAQHTNLGPTSPQEKNSSRTNLGSSSLTAKSSSSQFSNESTSSLEKLKAQWTNP